MRGFFGEEFWPGVGFRKLDPVLSGEGGAGVSLLVDGLLLAALF